MDNNDSLEGKKIVKVNKGSEKLELEFEDGSVFSYCLVDEIMVHGAHILRQVTYLNGKEFWKDKWGS